MRPNKRKVQFWRRIQRTQTKNSTVGLPGAPLKLSPPLLSKLQHGQTSLILLALRYLEDEANDRGLNHETSEPF